MSSPCVPNTIRGINNSPRPLLNCLKEKFRSSAPVKEYGSGNDLISRAEYSPGSARGDPLVSQQGNSGVL